MNEQQNNNNEEQVENVPAKTTDNFADVALQQVKKFKVSTKTKKEATQADTPLRASSLDVLADVFDNERWISFVSNDDASESVDFRIKTVDPGILLLETSSPLYLKFAQGIANDENYIEKLTDEERVELLRAEIDHKYRVLEQCVLEPKLSGVEGVEGFPIANLPSEIVMELYSQIMGTATEGDDLVDTFQEEV